MKLRLALDEGIERLTIFFTRLALIQKQILNHGKLYVAFIDFKNAFDLVDRSCLWAMV